MTSYTVLVTGCLGAIGRPLFRELKERGHEVFGLDRQHRDDGAYTRCDVSEFRQLSRVFKDRDIDVVYHLAAEFGRKNGEDYYETMWRTNAIGTKNVLRLQEQVGFRLVFASSSEVYGDYRGVMAEDVMDRESVAQMNDYAISKWVNELQIMNSVRDFGTETVRLRLFNTYGPGEYYSPYRSAICIFVYKALHRQPYTVFARHRRTSSYIDDTVRTLANVPDSFTPGEVYNVAGLELHDMKRASDMILEQLGVDDEIVTYRDTDSSAALEKRVDVSKAIDHLGHQPSVDLEEGIRRTIAWQQEVYGIA